MPSTRILIVDDTPFNNEVLKVGLSAHGYEIEACTSAADAREALARQLPDLILLDVLMPEVNGYEFCGELKSDARTRDIPVIFMSALHETVDKLRGFSVGGVDYLTKPLDFDEVLMRVKTHVTLYHQRREIQRLYDQASELATMHERQRIARDLHDSINQSLFSINSIAEALPRIFERNADKALNYANQLAVLTRGAMAEMRALLLELRPEALAGADLADVIRQLCAMFAANNGIEVHTDLESGLTMPVSTQTVVYRVAQEALNNVAHHAAASLVTVKLRRSGIGVVLEITDDGRGFDSTAVPPDHFGLRIMRERAEDIGALLQITSQPDAGTTVRLHA